MDRANRIGQAYGYTVCLVAVVTVLFTLPNLIHTLFRLSDPLQDEGGYERFCRLSMPTRQLGSEVGASLVGKRADSSRYPARPT